MRFRLVWFGLLVASIALLVVGCQRTYDVAPGFVVADLFATPGRSLATLPPTELPQAQAAPSEPTQPAVPTVVGAFPTLPLPTPVPFPEVEFQDDDDEAERPPISGGPDALIGLDDNDDAFDDEAFLDDADSDFDALAAPSSTGGCLDQPDIPFVSIYNDNPVGADRLGCAVATLQRVAGVYQPFERGAMFWRQSDNSIFVIATGGIQQGGQTDTWWRVSDTWSDAEPEIDSEIQAPDGLLQPRRGIGKAWRENAFVREALGWATGNEVFDEVDWQRFENGFMFAAPGGTLIYIMLPLEDEPPYSTGEHYGALGN